MDCQSSLSASDRDVSVTQNFHALHWQYPLIPLSFFTLNAEVTVRFHFIPFTRIHDRVFLITGHENPASLFYI